MCIVSMQLVNQHTRHGPCACADVIFLGSWDGTKDDVAFGFVSRFWKMARAPAFGDEGGEIKLRWGLPKPSATLPVAFRVLLYTESVPLLLANVNRLRGISIKYPI